MIRVKTSLTLYMTTPTNPPPGSGGTPPIQPTGPQQPASNLDPSGAWSKFLSTPSQVATPEEVKMFMQGMLKMFNLIIQQQNAAYQRANEKLRKVAEGEDE